MTHLAQISVTLDRLGAEQWLGDTSGIDLDQTVQRYAERVEDALHATYPEAQISVTVDRAQQHLYTPLHVETADGQCYTEIETDNPHIFTIQCLLNDVFNGKFGEYLVELR